jgi:hypothetical protein
MTAEIIAPAPGTYLTASQGQRCECLRLALVLTAGRSVPISTVWQIARWLANGCSE